MRRVSPVRPIPLQIGFGLSPVIYNIGLCGSDRSIAINMRDPIRPIDISIAEDVRDPIWPILVWITDEIEKYYTISIASAPWAALPSFLRRRTGRSSVHLLCRPRFTSPCVRPT